MATLRLAEGSRNCQGLVQRLHFGIGSDGLRYPMLIQEFLAFIQPAKCVTASRRQDGCGSSTFTLIHFVGEANNRISDRHLKRTHLDRRR